MSVDAASCYFYLREAADGGGWTYRQMETKASSNGFITRHVPAVGDLVHLPGATVRVLARAFSYAQYGSAVWPYSKAEPSEGPQVDLIVERAEGPFYDEAEED